jgi:hypothetical protein
VLHDSTRICYFTLLTAPLSLSLFPVAPTWSTGHPWNASFHFSFLILYTVGRIPWTSDQPVARPLPIHKHRINAERHPCLECDSNPRPQCSSKRRHCMPYNARPLWSVLTRYLLAKDSARRYRHDNFILTTLETLFTYFTETLNKTTNLYVFSFELILRIEFQD